VRRLLALALLTVALLLPSCAPKVVPPLPDGEDYVYPTPTVETGVSAKERNALEKAWRKVLAGDVEGAVRDYRKILGRRPGLVSAETGLAYAHLRGGQAEAAAAQFVTALEHSPDYVPALVGAGSTAFRRGDVDAALALYQRAHEVAPDDARVRQRAASLKLQVTERHMAAAREAVGAGDDETAVQEYRAVLEVAPEVAEMRLALAELEVTRGDTAAAVATLRADPSGDREVELRLGQVLLGRGDYEEARGVYREMLARDPGDAEARQGERTSQEALDFQAQPEEYRRIASAERATRADLAALLAVKVTALARLPPSEPRLAVDISGSWARESIARVVGLGVMEVYPNHTFQPRATVRRADLARASSRVLVRLGWRGGAGPAPADMRPSHLDHAAVRQVVAAGLMGLQPGGEFEPWRPVSGREATEVVEGLSRLVDP
jgi:tetratricopeptide (TPR) repeat protein